MRRAGSGQSVSRYHAGALGFVFLAVAVGMGGSSLVHSTASRFSSTSRVSCATAFANHLERGDGWLNCPVRWWHGVPTPVPVTVAPPTTVPDTTTVPPSPTTTIPPTTTTVVPVTTVPVTTVPATTTTVPAGPINSVARVESDMEDANVVFPDGVPSYYSWYGGPGVEAGNRAPSGYSAITMWGQLYPMAGGSPGSNVLVEMRDAETWIYSLSRQEWIQVEGTAAVEGDIYPATYNGPDSPATGTVQPDGGYAVEPPVDGSMFHFWPTGNRATITSSDIGGVFTTVQARLIPADPSQPADLEPNQYVLDVGADYWLNPVAPYPNNAQVFQSRFDAVSGDWQSFDAITWTPAQIQGTTSLPLNAGPLTS